jgi:hypothetical protein
MTNNRTVATGMDVTGQSCDSFSENAFATLIDDDRFPGFDSLNSSNFFDQVMNASKIFDGEESVSKLNDSFACLSEKATMNRLKKTLSRRNLSRKTMPTSFIRNDLGQASFWVEESIDEEDTEREEAENEDHADTEDFQAEILCSFILKKVEKIAQEQRRRHDVKGVSDGESNAPAAVSVSSNLETVAEATENGLGLAVVARNAEDHVEESRRNRKSSKRKPENKPKVGGESAATTSDLIPPNENDEMADVTNTPFDGARRDKRDSYQRKRVSKTKGLARSEDGPADDLVSVATNNESATSNKGGNMSDVTKKALALANAVRGAEDAVRQMRESKTKRNSQPKTATKPSEDGESVTTAAESVSSSENGVAKKALALAMVVSDTGDTNMKQKTEGRQKRRTSSGRQEKAGQEMLEGERREAAQEKRRSSRVIGSKQRRRRAGSVDSRLRSMKDNSEMTSDTSSRRRPMDASSRNNHTTLGEPTTPRRAPLVVPPSPRRNHRFCAERTRSFGTQATKEPHDLISASPMTPRRNRTLPSERPTLSSEIRRVTRDPRLSRRASLGHSMLKSNVIRMDPDEKEDDVVLHRANTMGGSGAEKQEVWMQRRLRASGDASDGLAHQKTVMARAATIRAASVALTTPRVAAKKLCVDVDSAIDRLLLAGVGNGKNKDDASTFSAGIRKVTRKVKSKDDSFLLELQHAPPATPVSQRRMRRRGSCSG